MSLSPFPLSFSQSVQALNNLKLYSTAGDKVNQTAETLTETEGDDGRNITARYLTLCDKQNTQRSSSTQREQFPRLPLLDYISILRLSLFELYLHVCFTCERSTTKPYYFLMRTV